jgi:hypothetical protein
MMSHRIMVASFTGAVAVAVVATVFSLGLLFTIGPMLAPCGDGACWPAWCC